MKKILFASYSLDVGGIETALITLLKNINQQYEITLVLEKKEGIFINQVPQNIKIIEYKVSKNKIKFLRKFINFFKQLKFKMRYKNKFDFSVCYATYSYPASFVARTASTENALWVHNDYMNFYKQNEKEYKAFFKKLKVEEYKKVIFVSENDKNVFINQFPEYGAKAIYCNNLIDYNKIQKQAEEKIDDFEPEKNDITFINIGRHDEKQKKLSRIIEATKRLNKENYKFRVIFIGDGTDNNEYRTQAKDIKNIEFFGAKKNPYPYLKQSDCLIMSSDFEGYPVVFIESLILGKPIITTNVSDSKKDIQGKYGIVVEKTTQGIYSAMKQFLDNGFEIREFNPEEYNKEILEKLKEIIE